MYGLTDGMTDQLTNRFV